MAYGDGGDNARIVLRTIQRTADVSGRARRTELLYYMIATALIGVVINFTATTILPFRAGLLVSELLRLPLVIPTFALFARRAHDLNRSAWWSLIYGGSTVLSFIQLARIVSETPDAMTHANPLSIIAFPLDLCVLGLIFWPGTGGPNQYGDDPRTCIH